MSAEGDVARVSAVPPVLAESAAPVGDSRTLIYKRGGRERGGEREREKKVKEGVSCFTLSLFLSLPFGSAAAQSKSKGAALHPLGLRRCVARLLNSQPCRVRVRGTIARAVSLLSRLSLSFRSASPVYAAVLLPLR